MNKIRKSKIKRIKDLGIPSRYSLKDVGISQSLLQTEDTCSRKFLFKLNRYYHIDENINTSFGNIVHYCLDQLYKNPQYHKEPCETMICLLENYKKENQDNLEGIDEKELQWELNVAQIVLEKYVKYYPEDFIKKTFTDVEKEGSIKFGDYKLNYKIDGKFIQKSKIWLMEHKTKSRISEGSMMQRLSFDFQNLFYLLCEELSTGEEIIGVLYNIIRKPQIKQKKNETELAYYKRLSEDIDKRPEFYLMRYEIPYTDQAKEEFKHELMYKLSNLITKIWACERDRNNYMFDKKQVNCEFPYPCKFIEACSSGKMTNYSQKKKLFPELKTIKD